MKVLRAAAMGMCFGVRDALQVTQTIAEPRDVTIHGELVHNPEVVRKLTVRGFQQTAEERRKVIPGTPLVLITAHGVSDRERHRLQAANKQLIDTTCPLVRRVHEAAQKLQAEGRHVLVIGKRGHVEVQGIIEDLHSYDVIGAVEEVKQYETSRLGMVCQTTVPPDLAESIHVEIRLRNPLADICWIDTICQPTRLRQWAMHDLLHRVDAMVVVGGRNSNNTRQLVRLCQEHQIRVLHVERADELPPAWFADVETVGLTAGTSTLDSTIDEIHQALLRIGSSRQKGTSDATAVDTAGDAPRSAT